MLDRLALTSLRHPRRLAVVALAVLILAGIVGGPAAGLLKARNSFQDTSSPSAQAEQLIQRATGAESHPGVLALVDAQPGSPAVASVARTLAHVPGVAAVVAPRGGRPPTLVSKSGQQSLVAASLRPAYDPNSVVKQIRSALSRRPDVLLGGTDVAGEQVSAQATKDLGFAELIAFPLLAVLALVIFRGVAALLPVAVGATAVLGTFAVLRLINLVLALSSFSLNLVIGLGLGLAIDYSLLLVWRFREELGRGEPVAAAVRTTLATAGRTVIFSAVTVAAALASLMLFPQRFLISMGLGGVVVALVAAASALLVIPPLLVLLAGRIGKVRPQPEGTGRWYEISHAVMRRPALLAAITAALLLLVAAPSLRAHWSGVDATVLPAGQSARTVSDRLARDFPAGQGNTVTVAVRAPRSSARLLQNYARRLARVPGVVTPGRPAYLGAGVWRIDLAAAGDPISARAQATIGGLRALPAPAPALIGGQAADFYDQQASIAAAVPAALAALAVLTLLVLWLMTDSLVLPVKALLMNALTAAAATGLLVLIFQDGRLTGPLDYVSQGGIEQTDFLVLAALVFALSTDYGVLLLTRIKEAHDEGLSDRESVATGLEHTGRLVTASAILLMVAIGAFATSHIVFLKEIGLGAAAAVLIDAFLVRAILVPSLMALLGRWNWWSPAFLHSIHRRVAISEGRPRRSEPAGAS